jgi:hypothetical protein
MIKRQQITTAGDQNLARKLPDCNVLNPMDLSVYQVAALKPSGTVIMERIIATGAVYMTNGILVAAYMQAGFPVVNLASGNSAHATAAAPAPTMIRLPSFSGNCFLNNPMSKINPTIRVTNAKMGFTMDPWFQAT